MNRPLDALREWVINAARERQDAALRRLAKRSGRSTRIADGALRFGQAGFDAEYGGKPFSKDLLESDDGRSG